ncbi:hypothetical protein JW872_01395 [Candidatus Babeliales bacterium]|nr:hypothetical protein [Candidatus Babeliales bacterium]
MNLKTAGLLSSFISSAIAYVVAVVVSGYIQAWFSKKLGDDTAERHGFLSLNPMIHIDVIGFIVFIWTGYIGWGTIVPINPQNFSGKYKQLEFALVHFSRPLANLFCAFIVLFMTVVFFGGLTLPIPQPHLVATMTPLANALKLILAKTALLNISFAAYSVLMSLVYMVLPWFARKTTASWMFSDVLFLIVMFFALIAFWEPLMHIFWMIIMGLEIMVWKIWSGLLSLFGLMKLYR